MRSPLPLVTAALLCALQPALARAGAARDPNFELRCRGADMKPVLEVRAHEAPFVVDNSLSSRVLHTRDTYGQAAQMMLGLTSSTVRTEIAFDGRTLLDKGASRECISPRVWVDLSYDPVRVYVAREFSAVSCSYRTIFAHEMRHIQLNRTQLELVGQAVRAALAQRYGDGPLYAPAGHGLDQLAADVDNWLRPLVRAELARVAALQRDIDTPDEDSRLSQACGGEIASTLGNLY